MDTITCPKCGKDLLKKWVNTIAGTWWEYICKCGFSEIHKITQKEKEDWE